MRVFGNFFIAGILIILFIVSRCKPDASLPEDVINSIEKRIE
jgi:hypothetical protein